MIHPGCLTLILVLFILFLCAIHARRFDKARAQSFCGIYHCCGDFRRQRRQYSDQAAGTFDGIILSGLVATLLA